MPRLHLDFAVLLTVLTLLTGVGWPLDKWVFAARSAAAGIAKPSLAASTSRGRSSR